MKRTLLISCFVWFLSSSASAGQATSAEEILQRHLESLGSAPTRSAAKSRVVEGTASYRVLRGGEGQYTGKAVVVSDGNRTHILLKIEAPQYVGERFISDGDKTSVEGTNANKTRSEFGTFLRSEDLPLREGLLGGVLTTAWPLLDLDAQKGKLHFQGLLSVDGTNLYAATYQPHKRTGLEITLYFDPATLHHVRTVYTETEAVGIATARQIDMMAASGKKTLSNIPSPDARSARMTPQRWKIEEQFDSFKTTDGLTLPSRYDLRFEKQMADGSTKTVEWEVTATRVLNNVPVDARNFQVQ